MTQADCNVHWRLDAARRPSTRPFGLLVEVTATDPGDDGDDAPINVGLAIDRSGSMRGSPLEAAKIAAHGVVDCLGADDFVTVATFDTEAATILAGLAMNDQNKHAAQREIMTIRSGGTTALFDGWCEAARGVAEAAVGPEVLSHVVMLSDGRGNRGPRRPVELQRHAAELSRRGIRSSCVGIGENYSTPQLAALAEGGDGLLHHASEPDEIIEVVLGEIARQRSVAAEDVAITFVIPAEHAVRVCGGRGTDRHGDRLRVSLGALAAGQTVRVALLFDQVEADASTLCIETCLSWTPVASSDVKSRTVEIDLRGARDAIDPRDLEAAGYVAFLWHADLCRRAMDLNDRDRFDEAFSTIRDELVAFSAYVHDLPDGPGLLDTLQHVSHRSSRPWRGRSKKEAYIMMRKRSLSDPELRDSAKGFDLSKFLDE